jgi:hypothetical protein
VFCVHQRFSIHGEAASETVRKLKTRLSARRWSGPEQLNIAHGPQAGH